MPDLVGRGFGQLGGDRNLFFWMAMLGNTETLLTKNFSEYPSFHYPAKPRHGALASLLLAEYSNLINFLFYGKELISDVSKWKISIALKKFE